MTVIVITNTDLDDKTTGEKNQKLTSNLVFTDREATVPSNAVTQFLFRELDNANQIMACTGILVEDTWYGDRPDDGVYTNPFTNQVLRRGNPPKEKVGFYMREDRRGNTIELIRWSTTKPTMTIYVVGGDIGTRYNVEPSETQSTTLNGEPATNYIYRIDSVSARSQQTETVIVEIDGQYYDMEDVPRLSFSNRLGVFGYEADSVEELKVILKRESSGNPKPD